MTGAVLRTLWLELRRDRGALVMAFVLPVVFFLVFAWIFAGTSGSDLRIRLAVADGVADADSRALLAALAADDGIEIVGATTDAATARERVRKGSADAGLLVKGSLRAAGPNPPLLILYDPARQVAASMLAGRVQRAYVQALPDAALGGVIAVLDARFLKLDDAQRTRLDAGLRALREGAPPEQRDLFGSLYRQEAVAGEPRSTNSIAYYAGAVAILFVLFSAVHGAITLLADRDAGIIDRVLAGPAGMGVLVNARFLFLAAMGFVQILVIYLVAWLGYGVDLPGHLVGWVITTLAVALCAAGLALALVTACGSQRQAQTVSNVAILILSAVGGSMVPRFFMPPLLQDLGWLTPNTWGLEAYTGVFWRGDSVGELVLPIVLLVAAGVAGWLGARALVRRWEVI
jgi:ABC-2 type transport system permease protein